jgi:uncharacterized protein (DUF2267 family)
MVEYTQFLDRARRMEFVKDPDAAVKAVYGVLASRLEENDARQFTERLPEPLTIDKLRGQQVPTRISVDDALTSLAEQLHISRGQAGKLLMSLTRFARESIGREVFEQAAKNLPENWAEFFLSA